MTGAPGNRRREGSITTTEGGRRFAQIHGEPSGMRNGDKVAGGHETVLSYDFGLRVGAAFGELGVRFCNGRELGRDGDSRASTPGSRAVFENAVVNWRNFFHVAGFAPVHAELEGEDVAGPSKPGVCYTAEFLKATEKQSGAGEQG